MPNISHKELGIIKDVQVNPTDSNDVIFSVKLTLYKLGTPNQQIHVVKSIILGNPSVYGFIDQNEVNAVLGSTTDPSIKGKYLNRIKTTSFIFELDNKPGNVIASGVKGKAVNPKGTYDPNKKPTDKTNQQGNAAGWPAPTLELGFTPIPFRRTPEQILKNQVRIGYAVLDVPINFIQQTRTTSIERIPLLRQPGSIKKNLGMSYENFTLTYMVQGSREINNSVLEVLQQLIVNPFVTVEGGPFGILGVGDNPGQRGEIPYSEIAVRDYSISTIPGFPNALSVEINFEPFMWDWYCAPVAGDNSRFHMDDMICYPLYEIWCKTRNRKLIDGVTPSIPQIPTESAVFDGLFELSFPDESSIAKIVSLLESGTPSSPYDDRDSLNTLKNKIQNNGPLISPFVKEIIYPEAGRVRYFVIKVSNSETWKALVPNWTVKYREQISNIAGAPNDALVGFIDWEKLKYWEYTSEDGEYIPSTNAVDFVYLQGDTSNSIRDVGQGVLSIIDVNAQGVPSDTINNKFTYDQLTNPWDAFGIVLGIKTEQSDSTANRISEINRRLQSKLDLKYESLTEKIKKVFVEDLAEPSLKLGPELGNEIVIEKISGRRGHNIAVVSSHAHQLPIHTDLGGVDATFIVEGKCFGPAAKKKLLTLKTEFDQKSLIRQSDKYKASTQDNKSSLAGSFLRVKNEIFQLLGVDFVMPVTLSFSTVDGNPGVWDFSFTFIDYDPRLLLGERVRFLSTSLEKLGILFKYGNLAPEDPSPIVNKALEYFSLLSSLDKQELYQDKALPTVTDLRNWIQTCQTIAASWNQLRIANGGRVKNSILAQNVRQALNLRGDEQEVFEIITKYLPNYAPVIEKWDPINRSVTPTETKGYADPDFFCWYSPKDSWGNLLDTVTEENHGALDIATLSALGPKIKPNSVPQGYREYETQTGHYTWFNAEAFYAANPGKFDTGKLYEDAAKNVFPKEDAEAKRKVIEDLVDELDNNPGAWWNPSNSKAAGNGIIVVNSKDSPLPKMYDGGIPVEDPDRLVTPDSQSPSDLPNFPDYINSAWRSKTLLSAQRSAQARGVTTGNQLNIDKYFTQDEPGHTKTFLGVLECPLESLTADQVAKYQQTRLEKAGGTKVSEVQAEYGALQSLTQVVFPPDRFEKTISLIEDSYALEDIKLNTTSILPRSIWANLQYGAFLRNKIYVGAGPDLNPDQTQNNILKSYNFVHSVGAKFGIDPNIIRTFFYARTGFGKNKPIRAMTTPNWGDIDDTLPDYSPVPNLQILMFANRYKANLEKYNNSPSIALLATHIELDPDGKQYRTLNKGEAVLSESYSKQLQILANQVGQGRFDQKAVNAIKQATELFPDHPVLSAYYARYIELCRNLGGVFTPAWDVFFASNNPLITITATPNEGLVMSAKDILETNNTPDGKAVKIKIGPDILNTSILRDRTPEDDTFGVDSSGIPLTEKAKFYRKLTVGLQPNNVSALYGTMLDMRKHAPFNRLLGAFPSYSVTIINEGFYWSTGTQKLWDQFYNRTGIASIEVFKSKAYAAHTCNITYSNVFHQLSAYPLIEAFQHDLAVAANKELVAEVTGNPVGVIGTLWDQFFLKNIPEEVISVWQNNHLKQLALTSGARLHVRMGYGSAASKLVNVFNGTVIEAPVSEGAITLFAVGDGAELEKPSTQRLEKSGNSFAYQSDSGLFGIGKDPASIIAEALISVSTLGALSEGRFARDLSQGIAHFGEVYFDAPFYYPSEMLINIYSSKNNVLEQSIPPTKRYFNINAIYNFDNAENDFSVEVHEPTPFKVARTCSNAVMDFVSEVVPFGTRSTLFFGKPWYPYNYNYSAKIGDFHRLFSNPDRPLIPGSYTILNSTDLGTLPKKLQDVAQIGWSGDPHSVGKLPKNIYRKIYGDENYAIYVFKYEDGTWISYKYSIVGTSSIVDTTFDKVEEIGRGQGAIPELPPDQNIDISGVSNSFVGGLIQPAFNILNGFGLLGPLPGIIGNIVADPNGNNTASKALVPQADLFKEVSNLVKYLEWKPFMQAYIAHSAINLIANDITTDSSMVYTDAVGKHIYNAYLGGESIRRSITYSLDTDIWAGDRKTLEVDTGILLTAVQGGFPGEDQARATTDLILNFMPLIGNNQDLKARTPSTTAIQNSIVSALVDSAKEMYQGWFTITGLPSVKPRDLFFLTDHKTNLTGPVFVKEVVHKLDSTVGFVTMVSPDAVVFPRSSEMGLGLVKSLATGALSKLGIFYTLKAGNAMLVGGIKRIIKINSGLVARGRMIKYRILLTNALNNTGNLPTEFVEEILAADAKAITSGEEAFDSLRSNFIADSLDDNTIRSAASRYSDNLRIRFVENNTSQIDSLFAKLTGETQSDDLLKELATLLDKPNDSTTLSRIKEITRELTQFQKNKNLGNMDLILDALKDVDRPLFMDGEMLKYWNEVLESVTGSTRYLIEKIPGFKSNMAKTIEELTKADSAVKQPSSSVKLVDWLIRKKKQINESVDAAKTAKAGVRGVKTVIEGTEIVKEIQGVMHGVRLFSYMSPLAIVQLAFDVALFMYGDAIVKSLNARFTARQAATIIPLRSGPIPLTAGIKGHQGLVIGDDPGWGDKLLSGEGMPEGYRQGLFILAALTGVEVPTYGTTPLDSYYLDELRKELEEKNQNIGLGGVVRPKDK